MKKYKQLLIIPIFFTVSFFSKATVTQNTSSYSNYQMNKVDTLSSDSLTIFLQNMNLTGFCGRVVDSFLVAIPNNPSGMFVSSCKMDRQAMYKACYLQVSFTPDIVIRIYVTNYTHLTQYNPNLTWDVALFRQEIIHKISIYKDNTCINGLCRD